MEDERKFQKDQVEENRKAEDDRKAKEVEDAKAASTEKVQEERKSEFKAGEAEFKLAMENFVRVNNKIQDVVADASDGDQ